MNAVTLIHNGDHAQFERDNANVPKEERADWPLPSFDARDWAKAFCKQHPYFDETTALAWFANALMRGFDEGTARAATAKTFFGGHYRRMDPQPADGAVSWRPGYQSLITRTSGYRIGSKLFSAPGDMPAAKPWRDRDGEWFWRTDIR